LQQKSNQNPKINIAAESAKSIKERHRWGHFRGEKKKRLEFIIVGGENYEVRRDTGSKTFSGRLITPEV